MRAFERDDIKIPKRYKKMSIKQLEKKSQFILKISKMLPRFKRKKIDYNKKVKFYLWVGDFAYPITLLWGCWYFSMLIHAFGNDMQYT